MEDKIENNPEQSYEAYFPEVIEENTQNNCNFQANE